ncbi:DUF4861 domain-containing protein [Saccharicrinis sp. FJH65]|uniref:DUF4861 domain-containing protein n=1 Tax=Saccharicrinis sp. FJH65 TaxID=3344659 RepID=UPI0036D3EF37
MMKKHFITTASVFLMVLLFTHCGTKQPEKEISLTNTSDVNLIDKAISVKRSDIPGYSKESAYPLILSEKGDTIPSQLNDLDGDKNWDELFFVADLPAKGSGTFTFKWVQSQPHYVIRTSARFGKRTSATTPVQAETSDTLYAKDLPKSLGYQPYQTDGPSWENDKVGFRHYFDGRNANDLFGKKAPFMSPEDVGINAKGEVEDNYHVMADWGRDILSVGNSVGLGGFALMTGDQLLRLGVTVNDSVNNVAMTSFEITAEGPVKSVMNYHYMNWNPEGEDRDYDVKETTSIWPGMYAYQNKVEFDGLKGDETLVVGLVNINNQNPLEEIPVNDQWMVLLTHDMQTYDRQWWLGLALIVPRDIYEGYTEAPESGQLSNTFLAKLKVSNHEPVTYYAAAGWEIADEQFKDHDFWVNYVVDLTRQLSAKVDVSVKPKAE